MSVYAEKWRTIAKFGLRSEGDDIDVFLGPSFGESRARLAAAAPALVRALLDAEHASLETDDGSVTGCPTCGAPLWEPRPEHLVNGQTRCWVHIDNHKPDCIVDAALTAAGLATQAERDAVREEMAKR